MRLVLVLLLVTALGLGGCGDDDEQATPSPVGAGETKESSAGEQAKPAAPAKERAARGTEIVLGDSEFGQMLFGADKQAIYIFENDPKGESVCYDDCAEAWPPVYTKGEPRAGDGVRSALLGTVERRDGRLQVTYAGKPLYFYVNEGPGEVRCHNVDLNGGLWWVVGANGQRRP